MASLLEKAQPKNKEKSYYNITKRCWSIYAKRF